MEYVFYLDVFWITNAVMDYIILLVCAAVMRQKLFRVRRVLAAVFAATVSTILFLTLTSYSLYQLLIHILINPFMVLLGIRIRSFREFVKMEFSCYTVTLLLGGIFEWFLNTLQGWEYWGLGILLAAVVIVGIFYQKKQQTWDELVYQVQIAVLGKEITVVGFLDTGNLLVDPFLQKPVHIIQKSLLQPEMSDAAHKIRYIPFHSLGEENGLLEVITADYMKVTDTKDTSNSVYVERPVLGLAKEALFRQKKYQMILNQNGLST